MRHETKLRIIKRAARVSNFKNVCQTVAKRHQHLLCFYMHSNLLLAKSVNSGPCKPHSFGMFSQSAQHALKHEYNLVEESILSTSFVNYNGITFKPNAFILRSYSAFEPIFYKISTIIKIKSEEFILILHKFVTEYYDHHYNAFCIAKEPSTNTGSDIRGTIDILLDIAIALAMKPKLAYP